MNKTYKISAATILGFYIPSYLIAVHSTENGLPYYDNFYMAAILLLQLITMLLSISYVHYRYLSGNIHLNAIIIPLLITLYLIPSGKIIILEARGINAGISIIFNRRTLFEIISVLILQALSISIYLFLNYINDLAELRKKKNDIKKLEAGFLESQLDNHFLFNSLNSIYGLAVSESVKTADSILLLSDILSFILYDTRKEIYTVSEEIRLMERYIKLQQIRFSNKLDIEIKTEGYADRCYIKPLILFSLLENSIKHSAAGPNKERKIAVKIQCDISDLHFYIENSCKNSQVREHTGIGLINMNQRLRLLYPDAHSFTRLHDNNTFKVKLSLFTH
jgi:LytS/YehU family sensor histidine kinase